MEAGIIYSYHLKDITDVISTEEENVFKKEEIEKLELTVFQNPAFPINEIVDAKIKLFKLYIHPYKVENDTYYFKGSLQHLVIYFFKFASEVKFIDPDNVKEFVKSLYLKAYNQY